MKRKKKAQTQENSKTKEKYLFTTFQINEKATTQEKTVIEIDGSNNVIKDSNHFKDEGFFHEKNVKAVPITHNQKGMIAGIVVGVVAFMIICSIFICSVVMKKIEERHLMQMLIIIPDMNRKMKQQTQVHILTMMLLASLKKLQAPFGQQWPI